MGLTDAAEKANRVLRRAAEFVAVLAPAAPDERTIPDLQVRQALAHLRETWLTTTEARERFALRLAFAEEFGDG